MKEYTKKIHSLLSRHKDELTAQSLSKRTKNKFKYLGIKTVELKELIKNILSNYPLPKYNEIKNTIRDFFSFEEREYLYFGIFLFANRRKMWQKTDIVFIESLILTQPGWDTTEYISSLLLKAYYEMYPKVATEFYRAWSCSKNQWLKASAIMFQRTMKQNTNIEILDEFITANINSTDDIVNKAIGAALRDYSKTNYKWVLNFVVQNSAKMDKKAKQEAIKWMDSKRLIK